MIRCKSLAKSIAWTAAAALLAACVPEAVKNAAPPIGSTVTRSKAPDKEVLPVIASEPVAADADKASDNYRKLLELQPDSNTKAESMRRLADLQVQAQDARGNDEGSETALRDAIRLYNELLNARPDEANNDRVFYQLARAYQNAGDADAAIDTLQRLTERHPKSKLAGDARFRRAELLFLSARYEEAESEYSIVMDVEAATAFFEPAQYKMAWSRYKQGKYESAVDEFLKILDRELPPGELFDRAEALSGVGKGKLEYAQDSLRVTSLAFGSMGGGSALNDYLARKGDPRYFPLLYASLGEQLMEKQRYSDAAGAYAAFTQRHPKHRHAPSFQSRVIASFASGGFRDLVVREKERYALTYDPQAAYWAGATPTAEVMGELRVHLGDLAQHYYAKGGKDKSTADFLTAARWYQRIMDVYPRDPEIAGINFLLGESLYNGGRTLDAAREYTRTAYDYPPHPRAAEAGYAAVLAYQRHAKEIAPEARAAGLRQAIDSGVRFAGQFPTHPEVMPVLTRSAEDLFELKAYDEAISVAARVLQHNKPVDERLRRTAWGVTADSHFARERYAAAETAYSEELKLIAKRAPDRMDVVEQLAASVYKQGEAAKAGGDLRQAVFHFLRVATVTPESKIRATADYDGAAMLIQLEDWPAAARVLEAFRGNYPAHALEADVDKKLALVYEKDNKPAQAAAVYGRIARRNSETPEVRREAAWLAATLFDQAKEPAQTAVAYDYYVKTFPRPVARSIEGRQRLMELARDRGDAPAQLRWLREVVSADETAGNERSDRTRALGATASLELGRFAVAEARGLRLSLPIERSLPRKKQAMENAITALSKAANYGFAEITTAATFELGALYQDFGQSLMNSERPRGLQELELEQYNLLLEEQAFPFEEKAIETYEANLRRIPQGLYDEWIRKSYQALLAMAPGKYGKREQGEDRYDSLQ